MRKFGTNKVNVHDSFAQWMMNWFQYFKKKK